MPRQSCLVGERITRVDDGDLQRAPIGAEPRSRAIFGVGPHSIRDRVGLGDARGEIGIALLDLSATDVGEQSLCIFRQLRAEPLPETFVLAVGGRSLSAYAALRLSRACSRFSGGII